MKQLTCEMCGSTDLIKQDGVFVCQTCGTKYSVEEARKMMIEGTVEVTGTVRVDNSASINNYIKLANNAMDSSNNKEAEEYANKIIEIEPQNSTAWFIKGKAAGWQSTGGDNKIPETLSAWNKALEYASEEEASELKDNIVVSFVELFQAMINLYGGNYAEIHNDDALNTLVVALENGLEVMRQLTVRGCSFNWMAINNSLADDLNGFAVKAYKDAKNDYSIYSDFGDYKNALNGACRILKIAGHYAMTDSLLKTIASNLEVIDGVVTLTSKGMNELSVKTFRRYAELKGESIVNYVIGDSKKAEEEAAIRLYWEEHADEKKRLESEIESLSKKLDAVNIELENNSDIKKYNEKAKELKAAKDELGSLGLFKGKEKKALQKKISEISADLENLTAAKEAAEKELGEKKSKTGERIAEINTEFSKNRGTAPVKNNYYISGGIKDGKINVTVNQLAEVIKGIIPEELTFKGINAEPNNCYYGEMAESAYAIEIIEANDPKSQGCGVLFRCYADSPDSPIKAISFTTPQLEQKAIQYLVKFATVAMMTFDESATLESLANALTSFYKGALSTSKFVEENYSFELVYVQSNIMNIVDTVQKGVLIRNR